MKRILIFLNTIYWKAVGIVCIIASKKFFIATGQREGLYGIRNGLTIGDAKDLAKYLNDLAEKKIDDTNQEQAISEVRKIIEGK
jgi:hypothetical protein